jgi:histidine triad (HIT) family protein
VIPRRHIDSLASVNADDAELLGRLQTGAASIARDQGLESFRLVSNSGAGAGQSVFHLHYHLLSGRPMAWPPG